MGKGLDRRTLAAGLGLLPLASGAMAAAPARHRPVETRPLVIAHRGASAERPEHTLAAYALAIEQGADFIEPDLVMTKDGVLVARHENEISETTDVARRPEFAARRTTKTIDGETVTGWFTEDFTLAELKSLRARERLPQLRPANTRFDGQETIPTFAEVVALAKAAPRPVGVYPETKHPSYFRNLGLPMEEALLRVLAEAGWADARDRVFIQSFEVGNLERLRTLTRLPLVQLVAARGGPADRPGQTYAAMLTDAGLKAMNAYADAIGVEKPLVVPRGADGRLGPPTDLVARAHAAGLAVHAWTFRPENVFLPEGLKGPGGPAGRGDAAGEIRAFLAAGIDGLFTDSVPPAREAVAARPPATRGR
ncbi:glycerophosphodiester phosphodiesterase [Thermaurantiacus tibetensis]|uniref:glycerophosphodiester phosphodiesterase n=1 Tax=Thermaurantiacus tibetensis TaxID=2759035 RepID=UPI00188EF71B